MADNTTLNPGVLGDVIRDIDHGGVKTQVVALDAGGAGAESLVTLTNPMPVQPAATYFIAGTGNTSTAQLTAGATFTGTIESTLSQQAVSLLINSDQPITLTLNQYIDLAGTMNVASWVYNIPAGQDFAQSFTLNANYFNLTVKNTGAATTTTLNINTYYGTIMPAGLTPVQGSVPVVNGVMAQDISITTSTGTQSITNAGYGTLGVQISSVGTGGTVVFEGSNDNANWVSMSGTPSGGGAPVSTTSAAGGWWFDISGVRYFRVRATALTSGTITGSMYGSQSAAYTNNNITQVGGVAVAATAKATQASNFVPTQDCKDSGRTQVNYYAVAAAAGATGVETAITLTKSSGTSATSTAVSWAILAGKRYRITHLSVATRGNATATVQTTTFNFRINTAGAVTTTSTPVVFSARSATPATASAWDRYIIPIPDGFEILGDGVLSFGVTANSTYTTNAPTWDVTILGFEY